MVKSLSFRHDRRQTHEEELKSGGTGGAVASSPNSIVDSISWGHLVDFVGSL